MKASFKWSGPKGSAEQVIEIMKAQGRTLAESAGLDTPLPWSTQYREERISELVQRVATIAPVYSRLSSEPDVFVQVMQALAREAFELRCAELVSAGGQSGRA